LEVFDACKAAVFLHGLAGDYASYRESEYAMTAIDLLDSIREAFNTTLA
jgi:NAD(P)H-hydrate repair Nnr-like enzyme with NAD(P)H-hydrate dehydratase domain